MNQSRLTRHKRSFKIELSSLRQIIGNTNPAGPPKGSGYRSACVFLLLFNREDPHFLAIQKTDNHGYAWRNQVALPGGHIEETDAGPVEAAFRELEEEVDIQRRQIEFIGSTGHFQTFINPRDVQVFVGLWNGAGPIRCDTSEIARVLKIPLRELIQTHVVNNYHGRIPDVEELLYPFEDVVIWGVTARILHHFIELVYPLLVKGGCFHGAK